MNLGICAAKLTPDEWKRRNIRCEGCRRPLKAYGYELDSKHVALAMDILHWCVQQGTMRFTPDEVFHGDLVGHTQFARLKHFGLIVRENGWRLTNRGVAFLQGKTRLSRKVWVFHDQVLFRDDEEIAVEQADPRWKQSFWHWVNDYILVEQRFLPKPPAIQQLPL